MFLIHRFYLHLHAASTSSEGSFTPSIDSFLSASVDFGIETASRIGIEIQPTSFCQNKDGEKGTEGDFSVSALMKRVRWVDGVWTDASNDTLNEKHDATAFAGIDPPMTSVGPNGGCEDDMETPTIRRLAMQRLAREVEGQRGLSGSDNTAASQVPAAVEQEPF